MISTAAVAPAIAGNPYTSQLAAASNNTLRSCSPPERVYSSTADAATYTSGGATTTGNMALRRTIRMATTVPTTTLMLKPPLTCEWLMRSIAAPMTAIAIRTSTATQPDTPLSGRRDVASSAWAAYDAETVCVGASQPSSLRPDCGTCACSSVGS